MKHKRMSNRRIKQMLGDINHDGLFDEVVSHEGRQPVVEKKAESMDDIPPNINIDSENK
ncbi:MULTISPECIES: hypothetical protein [Photobacterium]|uniref:hypothetical protein n=1 Tax=Photobacterium TaxID=657 RepID=UPI000A6C8BA9|nr:MULTISPECIES: hypothetical protein [Photobacterium]MBV1841817.1 hypothetical protein [Photobacterium ganghwense]QSV13172.1 hypothetical protein FH974_10475 [Photobacterium ganghwense]